MLDSLPGPLFPCGSYHQPCCSVNKGKQYINRKCIIEFAFKITTNNPFAKSILTTHQNQLNVHNGVSMEIHHCITAILCRVACSPSWELELRPLGVATGNALSVTRSEDTYEKTPPVGRRQPMTSLPACHNISAAGRKHHQLFRLH